MEDVFKKYWVIGIHCTIVCKVLFLYPPYDLVTNPEGIVKTVIAIPSVVDSYEDSANSTSAEKHFFNLVNCLTIGEGGETEEDEKSDDSFQTESNIITVLKVEDCDALNALLCSTTIALFILFHSWKSFLF